MTAPGAGVASFPGPWVWVGKWVEPAEAPGGPALQRPAHNLAGDLEVGGPVASATMHATVVDSLDHYSKGAVISFLHRYVAGLQMLTPGYRTFLLAPMPGGGITGASTHHDSPHGRIEVSWRLAGGTGTLDVTVPDGTEADLVLPDTSVDHVGPGTHRRDWRAGTL